MRTQFYGVARQDIGQETNGGENVRLVSDSRLRTLRTQAWDLSCLHDLRVTELELERRELEGATSRV